MLHNKPTTIEMNKIYGLKLTHTTEHNTPQGS